MIPWSRAGTEDRWEAGTARRLDGAELTEHAVTASTLTAAHTRDMQ